MDPCQFRRLPQHFQIWHAAPRRIWHGAGTADDDASQAEKHPRSLSFPSDTKRIAGNRIKAHIFFGGENIRNEIIRQLPCNENRFRPHESTSRRPPPKIRPASAEQRWKKGSKRSSSEGKTRKKNYQFNIPSHLKLDMKAVAEAVGEKCEFEDPAVIQERFGFRSAEFLPSAISSISIITLTSRSPSKSEPPSIAASQPNRSL